MIDTKEENNAINQNRVENIDFNISLCRLCSEFKEDEPLIKTCKCMGFRKFVHFSCLKTEINRTQKDNCSVCNTTYTGIEIKTIPKGFCAYLSSDPSVFANVLCSSIIVSFLYYILYLAVIDYIMSDGLVVQWLRIILIIPTIIYGLIFTLITHGVIYKICSQFYQWRADHYRIVLMPLKSSASENPKRKSGFSSIKTKTLRPDIQGIYQTKSDTAINEQNVRKIVQNKFNSKTKDSVAISMDSTSNTSKQTLKEPPLAPTQTKNKD